MKKIKSLIIVISVAFFCTFCSNDDDNTPCPQTVTISMKINGELKQFDLNGWGIDLDNDGSGHTLSLWLFTGELLPQQNSYAITLQLPYKSTGNNIIEAFNYTRIQNGTTGESNFIVQGELESTVIVNTNTCFSATFSGSSIVNGNETIIAEGIVEIIYDEPLD